MSLSDPRYIGFLFLVFVLFRLLRSGAQKRLLLLAASYFFYFELSGYYIAVLFSVTAVVWFGALSMRRHAGSTRSTVLFTLICAVLLAPLLIFKYLPPLLGLLEFNRRTGFGIDLSSLAIPVGISFFSFAALGYLCDVYLEIVDPEPRLERVALFLAFFPIISAGPIERAQGLMPQLELDQRFDCARAFSALRIIILGLVMKVFIADSLSGPVNVVFAAPRAHSAFDQFFASVDYAFFLYADFAGYSLIAIGSARLLGLDVMPNFAQPFLSTTIPEYWRRWHMSLSFWIRDYVFAPIRTSWRRYPQASMAGALFSSFVLIGVWHGARWGYLFFGMIHGAYCIVSAFTLKKRNQFWARLGLPAGALTTVRIPLTFFLAVLAFVVYRADTLSDALVIYRSIFSADLLREGAHIFHSLVFHPGAALAGSTLLDIKVCLGLFALLIAGDLFARRQVNFASLPPILQIAIVNAGIFIVLFRWILGHGNEVFEYYKF